MLKNSLPTSASLSFEIFSFNNQSDFTEQLLHTKTGFPSNSYIPSVHTFLFIPSWHCPLTMPMKNICGKITPLFGLHYFPLFHARLMTKPLLIIEKASKLYKYPKKDSDAFSSTSPKLNLVIYSGNRHSINLN